MNIKLTLKNSKFEYNYKLRGLEYYEKDEYGNECLMIHGTLIRGENEDKLDIIFGEVFDKFAFEPSSINPPEKIEFY